MRVRGQGNVYLLLEGGDQTGVKRLRDPKTNTHCTVPPTQPSAAHPDLSNTFCVLLTSKECDILHLRGPHQTQPGMMH